MREVWKMMEDVSICVLFFQPFCKGRDRKFLQVHIANWLCYGWKSGVLLHPGVPLRPLRLSPGILKFLLRWNFADFLHKKPGHFMFQHDKSRDGSGFLLLKKLK